MEEELGKSFNPARLANIFDSFSTDGSKSCHLPPSGAESSSANRHGLGHVAFRLFICLVLFVFFQPFNGDLSQKSKIMPVVRSLVGCLAVH